MTVIKLSGMTGYYYVKNNELIYCYDDVDGDDYVQVSDLTDLTIYQYNQLAMGIDELYPNYKMDELKGRFI